MNTEDLDIFLAINQYKNISKAATELFISQSTLSYKLSILEAEVGARLFKRGKGQTRLALTEAGERFLLIAEKIRDLHDEALHVGDIKARTKLVVSGVDSVNSYFMIDFYRDFIRNHADIELSVLNGYSDEIPNKVAQGLYDIGISNERCNYDSIKSEVLFKEDYVCLKRTDAGIPSFNEQAISADELDPSSEFYQRFDFDYQQWHKSMFAQPSYKFKAEIAKLNVHLMDSPGDWAIMPYTVAKYYEDPMKFRIFNLTAPPPPRVVYIITNIKRNGDNSEAIRMFIDALCSYTKQYFTGV